MIADAWLKRTREGDSGLRSDETRPLGHEAIDLM